MIPIRPILHALFAILISLSVVCSLSMQYGHADVAIAATADAIRPLEKGDAAPRFVVETVDGAPFEFDPGELERPVLLLTFRGGWCPYCNMYLADMRHYIPDVQAMGVDVLFLSGDRADRLFASLSADTQDDIAGLGYTLLSDADAQAAIALGIAFRASDRTINRRREKGEDIAASSMLRHGVLPVPAVFAIDRHGVIQFAYTNADYKVRLPGAELLAVAREIAAAD